MFEKDVQPMLEEADVHYELRETGNYIVTMYSSEVTNHIENSPGSILKIQNLNL
jgi:hypothetical protein